jgi:hypothetical protein
MAAQTQQELQESGQREEYQKVKDQPHKDRVTQLVIIGVEMKQDIIVTLLDAALIQ